MQYTVRGVPAPVDAALRKEAHASGKPLNAVIVETLERATLPAGQLRDDLDWFVGSTPPGAARDAETAQAWLDSLPAELP